MIYHHLNWEEDDRTWGTASFPDILEESFWENVYRIETTGTGSTNINPDVQEPYEAIAPPVDYSNPNFNYLSSIVVGVDTLGNAVL